MAENLPSHIPVMRTEILNSFASVLADSDLAEIRYFDGTFGRGGHLKAILEADSRVTAVAFDQDPEAIIFGEKTYSEWVKNGRLKLFNLNFSDFEIERFGKFDLMLLDLGVSSPQLDQGHRGFSFYHDGPLDMRMNNESGATAADIVNNYSEDELIRIFKEYGEIFKSFRVVRAIVHDRKAKPFTTTRELAGLIERVDGWHKKGFHPATQYFMALRLEVNQELQAIENAFEKLVLGLRLKGRIAVLTFHSLEDRIIKNKMRSLEQLGFPVKRKVIVPSREEALQNPRARSAKLRVFEKGTKPEKRPGYFKDDEGDEDAEPTEPPNS